MPRFLPAMILTGLAILVPGEILSAAPAKTHASHMVVAKPAPVARVAAVRIDNFTFTPATLTVKIGTTVTWTNGDDIPHTVVATDKSFKSKVLDTDDRFSVTFTRPGTVSYFCSLHPHMTGKIIVTA